MSVIRSLPLWPRRMSALRILCGRSSQASPPAVKIISASNRDAVRLSDSPLTNLISMMLPLLHHGMCIVGLPYSNAELLTTRSGGTPYGVSHLAGSNADLEISKEEKALALAQGKHLAQIASKLS